MVNKKITAIKIILLSLVFSFNSVSAFAGYDYIDISNPFLRKIPLAVADFKDLSSAATEKEFVATSHALLCETLDFTGYFKILKQGELAASFKDEGIVASRIDFPAWKNQGGELLITGGVLVTGDTVQMEFRLFDVFREKLVLGKRYKGEVGDQRRMIRRFCSEVVFKLTGKTGLFDSRIAFVSTTTGNKEIYICDFDGRNPEKETDAKSITLSPAWSSDGKWLAYTSYEKGNPDLYIKNLESKRGVVVNRKGVNITPAWIPGQFALAATMSFSGDQDIYLLTGNGKIVRNLTKSWGIDVSPCFSPDGRKMAFVSKRSGTPQIYIMDMETSRTERLTFHGRYNTSPAWSPDGAKIAYVGITNGDINIYVINTDGSGLFKLTGNSGDNEEPSWSPDGSLIAFTSTREGISKIYVMTAYGTDQRRLINLKGKQTYPRWSPAVKK